MPNALSIPACALASATPWSRASRRRAWEWNVPVLLVRVDPASMAQTQNMQRQCSLSDARLPDCSTSAIQSGAWSVTLLHSRRFHGCSVSTMVCKVLQVRGCCVIFLRVTNSSWCALSGITSAHHCHGFAPESLRYYTPLRS